MRFSIELKDSDLDLEATWIDFSARANCGGRDRQDLGQNYVVTSQVLVTVLHYV